jgi:hypothetical protein
MLLREASRLLTWRVAELGIERLWQRILVLERLGREAPLPGAEGSEALAESGLAWSDAERAAHAAWLLLEGCGAKFEPAASASRGLRLFDELSLRETLANAFRALGAEGDLAWRLAARVRALLAHPDAHAGGEAWRAFLADDDARFAAGVAPGEDPRVPPAWLALPATVERATAPAD